MTELMLTWRELEKKSVMVATCYGGMVGEPYLKAMTGLSTLLNIMD